MLRLRRLGAVFLFTATLGFGLSVPACHKAPPTIVTDAGKNAYTADQVVLRLTEFQNVVIAASDANKIRLADARRIVTWLSGDRNANPPVVGLLSAIQAAPAGWLAIARQGWLEQRSLVATNPELAPWVDILNGLLGVQ